MNIITTNELTSRQIQEIENLEQAAFAIEGLENHAYLSNEINWDKEVPCFYLGYEKERLIAFLTTFMPQKEEAEIQAVTHPDKRKQGCFTQLLEAAVTEVKKHSIPRLLFAIETKSETGRAVLTTLVDTQLDHSEYRMEYDLKQKKEELLNSTISFEMVNQENKDLMGHLIAEAFNEEVQSESFLQSVIESKERVGFIGMEGKDAVATFSLNIENGDSYLHAVAVKESERGKGYGRQSVKRAIEEARKRTDKIVLDVDSFNPVALALYQSYGFETTFQVDYFSKTV